MDTQGTPAPTHNKKKHKGPRFNLRFKSPFSRRTKLPFGILRSGSPHKSIVTFTSSYLFFFIKGLDENPSGNVRQTFLKSIQEPHPSLWSYSYKFTIFY